MGQRPRGRGPGNIQSPHTSCPNPRASRGRSGIRWKVDPQRQAESKVKRDAGRDCNSGGIHSLSLIFTHLRTGVRGRTARRMELGL
jgi:hypothetical protein